MSTVAPRTRTVILLQGDDEERLSELRERAAELRDKADKLKPKSGQPSPSRTALLDEGSEWLAASEAADAAEAEHDAFRAEAEARGTKVIMRAIGRKKWRQIVANHPPRDDHEGDKNFRYNTETAPDEYVPACLASPALAEEDRDAFLDSLSFGQFDVLALVAHNLNTGFGADPTQRLASGTSQTSGETSNSQSAPE